MRSVVFYHKDTGVFHGAVLTTNSVDAVELNTPPDHVAIDHPQTESFDQAYHRVNLETGEVQFHPPPKPSEQHEWNDETSRWHIPDHVHRAASKRRAALAEVHRLNCEVTPVLLRKLVLCKLADDVRQILAELRKVHDKVVELEQEAGVSDGRSTVG